MIEPVNVSEIFGTYVFSKSVMRERLPKKVFNEVVQAIEEGTDLSMEAADVVANAMKDWAIEKGATHYTHWFRPLSGTTAEKHDSFVSIPRHDHGIVEFSGKELIKGEPDASSFPSGGIRSTFEARGYTTWDITSRAFIREDSTGKVLCIPTAFCSYTGEALDVKTPLLRSMECIDEQSMRIIRLFGNTTSKHVTPSVGPEQEYFIVDRAKYMQRKDLIYAGRTLFGAMPPKGQEMDDHYFGRIPKRIGEFMHAVNVELWKMGVMSKTEHNEAAPAQHELATIYCEANIAVDANQIVMETLKKVAEDQGLACLLHEKPFAGVNGSGKHNNWSLTTNDGINLFKPGKTPHQNKQFLLILACILKAIDEHADLLRFSAANVGNDHRLGSNEAPPAVISVFLGEQLQDIIEQLIYKGEATESIRREVLSTGASHLPVFTKDATDRNRTSPFAFTGNKFEFRMVGSSDTVATTNTILNTITAEAFKEAADILEYADDFDQAVHDLTVRYLSEHSRIIFNGNGYSEEWLEEAARRGLPNIPSMVDAIEVLRSEKAVRLFEKFGVFTKPELDSRVEIMYETYAKSINIEAKTMIDMAGKSIIPAVIGWCGELGSAMSCVADACAEADVSAQKELLVESSALLAESQRALNALKKISAECAAMADFKEQAFAFRDKVVPAMEALRKPVDELEMIVDKELWPMPSYGDLMFEV
ncbi:MAG: glutamine synthetase III [Lachnospiraceae bacterium]|nr:glutamine synthetase III [Lachnospiraceae bacterium]MBQ4308615.1 glutamine synthetase III [Lachnospiraceae bacterium]MBR0107272.1 glutamine synthetase III [Lachnospiraceae bacterium]MBR0401901.1 glutamine synthetase III [Lachnospiraceae bacterium]